MRRLFAALAIGTLLSTGALTAQIKKREKNQQKRINQGIQSGELTKKETLRIEAAEAKLHKQIKEDSKDGLGLTARERAKAAKKQRKLSKRIAKQKRDKQKRHD